jgi:acyl transferase domain-containing protein
MSKGRFLSPEGYCKSFDADANGYARGEGAGIVVLKPYAAAMRDRDYIYALVRGTGINQDGKTNGITMPNHYAQKSLIEEVYKRYCVPLKKVCYVEAHGTGTAVGDPIEASVLGETFGADRNHGDVCMIGSAKATIGHLEAAAGIAGLIKAALCIHHRCVPPQANLRLPNPKIPFASMGLRLPMQVEPISKDHEPLFVGVNAFGYGGTNAHVILEQMKHSSQAATIHQAENEWQVLLLSARNLQALMALARSYSDLLLGQDAPSLRDVCYSSFKRRMHHHYRLAAVANSNENMANELITFAQHGRSEFVFLNKTTHQVQRKPVFVFTGMGPQWWAMGRELFYEEPVFHKTAKSIDKTFQSIAGWSILTEMLAEKELSRIGQTEIAQPVNFLLQAALFELLRTWGVHPAAVVGHSVGEVTVAYVSGALNLNDAVLVSYHRSRLQALAAGKGEMLAIGLGVNEIEGLIIGRETQISVAAVNSPSATTLSGDRDALQDIATTLEKEGIFNRFLRVEVPYHSHHMETLEPALHEALGNLQPMNASLPIYSTVTGGRVEGACLYAEYWYDNIRKPVLFDAAIKSALSDGHSCFLELGPHPVLSNSINEILNQQDRDGHVTACLRRERSERKSLCAALGRLYTAGCEIDFEGLVGPGAQYIKLPHYPWQRETFWAESEANASDRLEKPCHPLLGRRISAPLPTYECDLDLESLNYLNDHVVDRAIVFPGAGYIEQGIAIRSMLENDNSSILEDLEFRKILALPVRNKPKLYLTFNEDTREYSVYSIPHRNNSEWTLHAIGRISSAPAFPVQPLSLTKIRRRCIDNVKAEEIYRKLDALALPYGPNFLRIEQVWRCDGEALAELKTLQTNNGLEQDYCLHPTLIDACIQSLTTAINDDASYEAAYIPVTVKRVIFFGKPNGHLYSYCNLTKQSQNSMEGDITLCDAQGIVVAKFIGLCCRPLLISSAKRGTIMREYSYKLPGKRESVEQELRITGDASC